MDCFPFVVDCTDLLAPCFPSSRLVDVADFSSKISDGASTPERLVARDELHEVINGIAAEAGTYFAVLPEVLKFPIIWREAIANSRGLHFHHVILCRHPLEVAFRSAPNSVPGFTRAVFDWVSDLAVAFSYLPNYQSHFLCFDELLRDPVVSLSSFFQSVPESRLMLALADKETAKRLIITAQPEMRKVFVGASVSRKQQEKYRSIAGLYIYLREHRLYSISCLRALFELALFQFSDSDDEIVAEENFRRYVSALDDKSNATNGGKCQSHPAFAGTPYLVDFTRGKEIQDFLLKTAEAFRKQKSLLSAEVIYRYVSYIDPKILNALAGLCLTLNDQKRWGEAMPLWDNLKARSGFLGTGINSSQLIKGIQNCQKSLNSDFSSILRRKNDDVDVLRFHLTQTHTANAHASIMRTRCYLRDASSEGALLVNDTRSQTNIGCFATTNSLMESLAKVGLPIAHTLTLVELYVLADLLIRNDDSQEAGDFDSALFRFSSHPEFHTYRTVLSRHRTIVVNGEGSFYDRQRKGLVLCVLISYAKIFAGCRVLCINHSADLHDEIMEEWVYRAYEHCDHIVLRENISFARLKPRFSRYRISVAPDAAYACASRTLSQDKDFFHVFDQVLAKPIEAPYVVVSGTSAIFRADREGFVRENVLAFNRLLKSVQLRGYNVVLLVSDNTDYKLLKQVAIDYHLPLVSPTASLGSVLNLLSRATAFISGRWHTSILAACVGTPSILGDANFFKTRSIHEDYRYPWPMFEFRNIDSCSELMIDAIDRCQDIALRERVFSIAADCSVGFMDSLGAVAKEK